MPKSDETESCQTLCPNCKKPIEDTEFFCPHCDAKLAIVCPHCGKRVPKGDEFCPHCGAKIDDFEEKYDFDSDLRETMVL
jgi:predicted amidophosphoribosyltransferase